MNSKFEFHDGTINVAVDGDLFGGVDAMKFGLELREALSAHPTNRVNIAAAKVGFVNSSGLGMLIAARQTALEHNASFAISKPSAQLRELLSLTKLTDVLGVID